MRCKPCDRNTPSTIPITTRTTAQSCPTSRPGSASAACVASHRPSKRNDSWVSMQSSTVFSIYNAIWCRRSSTGSAGLVRLNAGTKPLRREDGERLLL